jgi:sugar phosphate isomerase/epimerase
VKYSFMSFSTPTLSLAETIEVARRFGYDGIEPRLDSGHTHGIEVGLSAGQRLSIREEVEAGGIELACLATSITYADPAKSDQMIRQTIERIDLAGDLGVPVIRVFGGRIHPGIVSRVLKRNNPVGVAREKAIDLLARSLAEVADHAKERGVTVCIETHDDWCDPAHIAAVLQRVNHEAIAVNWDIMHPVRSANVSMDDAFQALKPWIRHLHIHDGSKTASGMLPIGTGDIDHRRALEQLKTIGYDGFISGEWIDWEPYEVHLPRELAAMKRYETELRSIQ